MMLRIQIRKGKEHLQQCVNTLGKQKFWEDIPVVFESEDKTEERMNEKDKEAFDKWWDKERGGLPLNEDHIPVTERQLYRWESEAWQAACEYKQKEIDELKYCSQVFYEATKKVGW